MTHATLIDFYSIANMTKDAWLNSHASSFVFCLKYSPTSKKKEEKLVGEQCLDYFKLTSPVGRMIFAPKRTSPAMYL